MTEGAFEAVEVLRGLPAAALEQARRLARVRRVAKDERLFNQGDAQVRAHVLLSGLVRVTQSGPDGGQVLLRFIRPGDLFGAVPIFVGARYPGDATAAEDAVEASWSEADFLALIRAAPDVGVNMLKIVGRRLLDAHERVRELSTLRAPARIACTLVRLARQAGDGSSALPRIRRRDIAELSGTTLYTASRVLGAWEREGLIASSRSEMRIVRPTALAALSRGEG